MPRSSPYSVHPSVAELQDWIASLKTTTGRSLDQWISLVSKSGPRDVKMRREWLKSEHGFGTNAAGWIAERASGTTDAFDDDPKAYLASATHWVDAMFEGGKAPMRTVYERLLALGAALGKDVKVCPCRTIVPLYRTHVFAQLKPSTRTRVDLGLALKPLMRGDRPAARGLKADRLIDTGGLAKKDRITHRIAVGSLDEIDATVEAWLRAAYEANP